MKHPSHNSTLIYHPPTGGRNRRCVYVREHVGHSGVWWELKPDIGPNFRARPGCCTVNSR